jgi:prevent-host-death family protein
MKLSLATAKAKLSEIVNLAEYRGERIVIEKRRNPVAVIIGYAEYKELERLEDAYESRMLEKAMKNDSYHSLDDAAKRLGLEL